PCVVSIVLEQLKTCLPHWARVCELSPRSLAPALTRCRSIMDRPPAPRIPSCLNLFHQLAVNKGGLGMLRKAVFGVTLLVFGLSFAAGSVAIAGDEKAGPEVGQKAPDFKLPYATQEELKYNPQEGMRLSQYGGNTVLLEL